MIKIRTQTVVFASWLLAACLAGDPAFSQDAIYYQGSFWTIQMVRGASTGPSGSDTYCEVRTASFEPRSIAIQSFPSGEAGAYRTVVELRKLGWQLPIGASAKVKVGVAVKIINSTQMEEAPPMQFKVESADTMTSVLADYDPSWQLEMANQLLKGVFVWSKYGSSLIINFVDGNEGMWLPKSVDRFDQQVAFNAYQQCLSDLSQMAANPAQGGSPPLSGTSPLKPKASTGAGSSLQPPIANQQRADQAKAAAPRDVWRFSTNEEDWGETCFVEMQKGDIKIGFMASPGEHPFGFVEGLFKGDTRATWHVDDKRAYVSDGGQNDYFGWHEFAELSVDLLDQISHGDELAITGMTGERVVVGLKGATEAVSNFKACIGTGETHSGAATARPE